MSYLYKKTYKDIRILKPKMEDKKLETKKVDKVKKCEYNKKYYANHKEEYLKRYKIRVVCDKCGKEMNKQNLPNHQAGTRCKKPQEKETPFNLSDALKEITNLKLQIDEIKSKTLIKV